MREIHQVSEKKLIGFGSPVEIQTFIRKYKYDIDQIKNLIAKGRRVQCADKSGAWIPDSEALTYFEQVLEAEITEFQACETVEDYRAYLENHPNGIFIKDVEAKIGDVKKEKTEFGRLRTIRDYQAFLERYPGSSLRDQANERIDALKQEEQDYQRCRSVEDYQTYLEKHPDGLRRRDAREKIRELGGQ